MCRGFREKLVPRVRKASKERPAYKGRWARPALGEKRENLVCRGFRENPVPRVRKVSKGRPAYKGRWVRPAPGEKRESLVCKGFRENPVPRVRKVSKGRPAYKGRWVRPAPGEKRESLVCKGFRENPVPRVRKVSKGRPAYKGRWVRPALGEKRESLVHRGSREKLVPRVRKASRGGRLIKGEMGPTGPRGEKGEPFSTGPQGTQGQAGPVGAQGGDRTAGACGETPKIAVEEDTPVSYKVSFKTSEQSFISPNLKSNIKYYNLDLSKAGSMVNIPIENLVLTYQNVSTSALRIGIQALSTSVPVLADIRRASIYNSGAVEAQSNNNATITTRLVLDDIVYSNSEETHWMRIRQRDPDSQLWSMCEVRTFASQGGARTSICVEWLYMQASFVAPS